MQQILIKYFTNTISPQEEVELLDWIDSSEENRKEYFAQCQVWNMYLLNREPVEPTVSFNKILETQQQKNTNRGDRKTPKLMRIVRELVKVAAILLVAYGVNRYFFTDKYPVKYHTIEVPSGQRVKLTLPDGSLVWLNAQTKFTYPDMFGRHTRNVTLDGEGLFEVTHHAKQPFRVQTPRYDIEVRGTKFNVYAYSNSTSFETTLIEGAVAVIDTLRKVYPVQPGHKLFYDEDSQQFQMIPVNPNDYISWKDGIYFFNDITFAEMAKRLGHYYNTKIVINDTSILNYHCTGKFRQHESITDIMDVVKSDVAFKYKYDKELNELNIGY